ncbi:MAG: hypothetical protein MK110_03695 [Fuerstiella sp.]|nr:hypothetical protein [Fuerstiella sp.]
MTGHRSYKRGTARSDKYQPLTVRRIDSGRALALAVLQQHDTTGRFVSDLLADLDSRHTLPWRERGLALDVAAGTLRRRRTIDVLLQSQVKRPRAEVEPDLWRLLQTGVQQLCFGRAPDHAAVDATVDLTRSLNRPQWAGFTNGVLRNITRLLTDRVASEAAGNQMPLSNGQFRELATDVFPCPATTPVEYFGEAFSMPRAIARRWSRRMGFRDLLIAGFHCLSSPTINMRINTLRTTVSDVVNSLSAANITTQPGVFDESLTISSAGRIESLPGYEDGHWTIQDQSAMPASRMLNPQAGETILDLCSAPGGKTTHLAELSGDAASICAADVSQDRLNLVDASLRRLRLSSVVTRCIDRDGRGLPDVKFDAAMVDVPCSNTGVLSRRPEARWRFREHDLAELVTLQTRLLMIAFDHLRPGGRLVYSTCSVEPEETTSLIRDVVQAVPSMTLKNEIISLPGQPADGSYAALLTRSVTTSAADPLTTESEGKQ